MTGFVDPSVGVNILRGGSVRWMNQAFGTYGMANSGSTTMLPSPDGSEWAFHCLRFANLKAQHVTLDRGWGHDWQATEVMLAAGGDRVGEAIRTYLDAAHAYGIECIPTLGGMSDPNTFRNARDLFDPTSELYDRFTSMAARAADIIGPHPSIIVLELLNEADFMSVVKEEILKRAPGGGMATLLWFSNWQVGILSAVRRKQKNPGCPLGMGTAIDGTLYNDGRGNPAMPWMTEQCIRTIIPLAAAGCDIWTPHMYQNDKSAEHLKVFVEQKLPSFVEAARIAGKRLIVAETGGLWAGGIKTAELEAAFDRLGVERCWMIRSWDPTKFTYFPTPPYSPAPTTPTDPPVEPSNPSDPAQEPEAGEPSEPEDPAQEPPPDEPEEPKGQPEEEQPSEETPEDDEPANEAPSDPPEAVEEDTSNSDKGTPSTPETGPRIGPGFVLWRVIEWILGVWGKLSKRWKK